MNIASWLPCKVLSIRRPGSTSCCEHQSLSNGDLAYAPMATVTGSWVRCMHVSLTGPRHSRGYIVFALDRDCSSPKGTSHAGQCVNSRLYRPRQTRPHRLQHCLQDALSRRTLTCMHQGTLTRGSDRGAYSIDYRGVTEKYSQVVLFPASNRAIAAPGAPIRPKSRSHTRSAALPRRHMVVVCSIPVTRAHLLRGSDKGTA